MRWVLDASALFLLQEMPIGEVYTSPGVLRELEAHNDNRIPFLSELLNILTPSKESLDAVGVAAIETGDDARLSPVDLELLALAFELEATLMSDDYSIQNLASHMGIAFVPAGKKGISKKLRWRYKCTGCGRIWRDLHKDCPICGAPLRSFRSKK
ncbi:MAG: nucleic acid-binding protein [Methanomassiliicoccales archaeon]|nr:nucleic acid-binding protein [Methanomassiliicoccales archaeon]NYT15062.1 nucleic acid-binding protein [Methanomassiliicoccales archaeon]